VRFLDSAAFHTPTYFVDESLTRRFEPIGTIKRLVGAEAQVLASLLSISRMHRLVEYEVVATDRRNVYPLSQMLGDVRHGVWTELSRRRVSIDAYRQGLQQAYLDQLDAKLNPPKQSNAQKQSKGDVGADADVLSAQERALLRGELTALRTEVQRSLPRTADRTTRLHLETMSYEISMILRPTRGGF
jgi:hypothetical protein